MEKLKIIKIIQECAIKYKANLANKTGLWQIFKNKEITAKVNIEKLYSNNTNFNEKIKEFLPKTIDKPKQNKLY